MKVHIVLLPDPNDPDEPIEHEIHGATNCGPENRMESRDLVGMFVVWGHRKDFEKVRPIAWFKLDRVLSAITEDEE